MDEKDLKIFISYKTGVEDRSSILAKDLRKRLIKVGYKVWIDSSDLEVGSNWNAQIYEEIEQVDVLLLLLSDISINSTWIEKEVSIGIKHGKVILPIIISEGFSPKEILEAFSLSDMQWIDYRKQTNVQFEKIKEAINSASRKINKLSTEPSQTSTNKEALVEQFEDEILPIGTRTGAFNDEVRRIDELNFTRYVNAFAKLITSENTDPPLTIGVFGPWGSGKSFLLENIAAVLENASLMSVNAKLSEAERIQVIRFKAWEYSSYQVIWPGLVREIINHLPHDIQRKLRHHTYKRNFLQQISTKKWNLLVWATLFIALGVLAWQTLGLLGTGAFFLIGLAPIIQIYQNNNDISKLGNWVTQLFQENSYGQRIDYMEAIKNDLMLINNELVHNSNNRLLGNPRPNSKERIVIFIDELDRCDPRKAVEVLEAIKLLLNFSSFIVFLGIDTRIITKAIEKYYDGLLGKAGISGYEYLDKIIQIPFRIPNPTHLEIQGFLDKQLRVKNSENNIDNIQVSASNIVNQNNNPKTNSESNQTNQDGWSSTLYDELDADFSRSEADAFRDLAIYLRPNPRHIKRLVNVYRLVRTLADIEFKDFIQRNPKVVIRWLTVSSQWPGTIAHMLEAFDGEPTRFMEKGKDFLPELFKEAQYQHSSLEYEQRYLEKLLSLDGGWMLPKHLSAVRSYTINFNPAIESEFPDKQIE